MVSMAVECRARQFKGPRRPVKIARCEGNLGLGNDTARPGNRFFSAESASCMVYERFCADEVSELRHGDASEGERRSVVS